MSQVIYLAHPVGAETPEGVRENIENAKMWVYWAIINYDVAVVANWIYYCEVLDDHNPEHRAQGMRHGLDVLERCDELWLVGGRVSSGMDKEAKHSRLHAMVVRDFTSWGPFASAFDPPELDTVPLWTRIYVNPADLGKVG
ncbi:hypothetical protein LCGC14_1220200 [marine sediment metagenome]|uniref:DUF7768 domain-containing protein n=1 Tax=marine sediment metagenome TaxID=412755 RepID=A0A0F9PG41_9ZZZZ